MTQRRECRRCGPDDIRELSRLHVMIQDRILLMSENERVSAAEYNRRLMLCRACDQSQNGTCMQCGCFVQLRAVKRGMHCAHCHPKW